MLNATASGARARARASAPTRLRARSAGALAGLLFVVPVPVLQLLGGATVDAARATPPRCPKAHLPATPPAREVARQPGHDEPPGAERRGPPPARACRQPRLPGDVAPRHPPRATADVAGPAPARRTSEPADLTAADSRHQRRPAVVPPRRTGQPARAPTPAPAAPSGTAEPAAAAADGPGGLYRRSLIYSGALGLLLASIGMTMVGRRRRQW